MRLLTFRDDGEIVLIEFHAGDEVPRYAILSHTWDPAGDEVTFQDMLEGTAMSRRGYQKIVFCGNQARRDAIQYLWVDTCCIDKSNEVEMTQAINSMFQWYRDAEICYAFLEDVSNNPQIFGDLANVPWKIDLQKSRWFTRAWTLPELLAPRSLKFFGFLGEMLGDRDSLMVEVHQRTGIPLSALRGAPLHNFSIDDRLSWAKGRVSTREEDLAYSLLGIFDVQMPILYGEGKESAFRRLYREIENSNRLGFSSSIAPADSASLTQRTARPEAAPIHRFDIVEPDHEASTDHESSGRRHCRVCDIILCLWILIAVTSLAVGLWRSFVTGDEGKGFTDAAYVVAIGGLILLPIQNRHNVRCRRK